MLIDGTLLLPLQRWLETHFATARLLVVGGSVRDAQGAWRLMLCAQGIRCDGEGGFIGFDVWNKPDVTRWRESAAVRAAVRRWAG